MAFSFKIFEKLSIIFLLITIVNHIAARPGTEWVSNHACHNADVSVDYNRIFEIVYCARNAETSPFHKMFENCIMREYDCAIHKCGIEMIIEKSTKREICQRCAKQTKSPIVYPMCCNEEDEVHNWCYRYTNYGKVA